MDPLFFPLTFMSDTDLEMMGACFQRFAACQPSGLRVPNAMSISAREGSLVIHEPSRIDPKMLKNILKEYRAWMDLHRSGGRSYLKNFRYTVPYFDEKTPSKIRSDIQRGGGREPTEQKSDSLFQAAVFLQIAQELDRQNADVGRDLDRVRQKERDLFESLHAESGGDAIRGMDGGTPPGMEDAGAYMTAERVSAWCRLMSAELGSGGLFVTTSRAVFDYILDRFEDRVRVLPLNTVAVSGGNGGAGEDWRHALGAALEKLASEDCTADCREITMGLPEPRHDSGLRLSIRLIAGESPPQFFARFIDRDQKAGDSPPPGKYPNTLVAHLGQAVFPSELEGA